MVNKLIATSMIAVAITFSSSPAPAGAKTIETQTEYKNETVVIQNTQILFESTKAVKTAVKNLSKTVGRTPYVFSGSTPAGFDCSGLTMWFYEQLDIELEHRASKQQWVGSNTKDPKVGDLVVFKYKGYKSAYHVGIYVGEGKMIHSPSKGLRVSVDSVKSFAGKHSVVSYRKLVDTV